MARLRLLMASRRDPLPVSEAQNRATIAERFWFDLAGSAVPNQVEATLKFTRNQHLLFGNNVPWMPFEAAGGVVQRMERDLPGSVGKQHLDTIFRGNAEQLFLNLANNLNLIYTKIIILNTLG